MEPDLPLHVLARDLQRASKLRPTRAQALTHSNLNSLAPFESSLLLVSAIDSSLFKQWLKNIESETGILSGSDLSLEQVLIQGVDMFGKRIGFLKFKADVLDKSTGKKVPGIVFARGLAVAILILLDSEDETYAVLTEHVRVPIGRLVLELPAGMLDDDEGDIVGTAVRDEFFFSVMSFLFLQNNLYFNKFD
ncbi:nudix hydrolase 14, chloroplastic-like [Humulus lupulus]|uniref:nudix hydrolase 14, chloroplastic-like n=1 Tax=Humulus lupulus TaxID=3486 RepID=UPI002B406900|nr:nudix hydrolase 14, chloroplastic-like [Humulus lupulus]